MRRCSRCILPENYPGITIDDEGVCDQCRSHTPPTEPAGREELARLLGSVSSTGPYDVVVPLSGGKDSTYVLYYAVKKLNLRAIAVHYDNGFLADIASANVANVCRVLNVPVEIIRSPERVQRRLLRLGMRVSRIGGKWFFMCGNCGTLLRTVAINVARKYGVAFVLWGSAIIEAHNPAAVHQSEGQLGSIVTSVLRKFTSPQQTLTFFRMLPWVILFALTSIEQRLRMGVPLSYAVRPFRVNIPFPSDPRFVHVFDYIPWNTIEDTTILKDELGWTHPQDKTNRFDCRLHSFGNYEWLRFRNISSDGVSLCRYIREGNISREEALREEEKTLSEVPEECRQVIRELGFKDDERIW